MDKQSKIYVAGHRGMVGSAIVRELGRRGYANLVTRTHAQLDLTRQADVEEFFAEERPDCVFLAAARVGGILANSRDQSGFLSENSLIELNVIRSAERWRVPRLLFVGSVCVYPQMAPQPISESCLMTGPFEPLDEGYAVAKLLGLKYCEHLSRERGLRYLSVMPTNLYGPNDNYHPEHSHVLPAMIRRFHEAKDTNSATVTCWGDGSPTRDFLYVDDFADLCVMLMDEDSSVEGTINAASGREISIRELASVVSGTVGYKGRIVWDQSKPNGTPKRALDISKARSLGWGPNTSLEDGIKLTYEDYLRTDARTER